MKLIVQPDAGIAPIISAIKQARKWVDILIFRLDRPEIARALGEAVARGVRVRALTAHQNRGGTKSLRKLEMQLLEAGVTVSRTADDLVRYHGKMVIVDNKSLHVYGFNFTGLDIEKSRSFGIVTKNEKLVNEATKLFTADFDRQPYTPGSGRFVVSPENARDVLSKFLSGARKELLIYDPKVSDGSMVRALEDRVSKGVEVRILGNVGKRGTRLRCLKLAGIRLHARVIIRDGRQAFLGSQSLRPPELDIRREIGLIVKNAAMVRALRAVFVKDWQASAPKEETVPDTSRTTAAAEATA
jgi:phosphatidylserine/phosphatidylglycerophosphate/cardiolipin synthase-like enzyme